MKSLPLLMLVALLSGCSTPSPYMVSLDDRPATKECIENPPDDPTSFQAHLCQLLVSRLDRDREDQRRWLDRAREDQRWRHDIDNRKPLSAWDRAEAACAQGDCRALQQMRNNLVTAVEGGAMMFSFSSYGPPLMPMPQSQFYNVTVGPQSVQCFSNTVAMSTFINCY